MKARPSPERNQIQKVCESILKWGIPGIAFFHIWLILAGYFISGPAGNALLTAEKWILVAFAGFALAYYIYIFFFLPGQLWRTSAFLKGLLRPEMILLLLLFVWNIFCVASADTIYEQNLWKLNDNALLDLFVAVFVLFAFTYVLSGRQAVKMLEILFHTIVAVMTVLMIWVLWAVCKPSVIHLPGGGSIGMTSDARLSICCHPNTVGAYAELILMMCLYMAVTKKGIIRILNILAMPVHYVVIILSDSRTCIIATALIVGAVAFKLVFDAVKGKTLWQRVLFSSLAFAVCFALLMGLRQPVRIGYESISHFTALHTGSGSTNPNESSAAINTGREMVLTTNGRVDIWAAAVKSAFSSFRNTMFGASPAAVVSEINRFFKNDQNFYTHNQFMEILVANGLPGLLLYLAWLVLIAKKCIQNVVIRANAANKGLVVIGGMILMLVISNLLEATLMYYRFFAGSLFFLLCGIVAYEEEDKKTPPRKKPAAKKGR